MTRTFLHRIKRCAQALELVGAIAAAASMFGCFAFGFGEITHGFVGVLREFHSSGRASAGNLLDSTLLGLEMFFLAPLPYLTFFSITKLYLAVISNDSSALNTAHLEVVRVKRLIAGLMIAVISTELIHRIIAGIELKVISVAAMLGIVVALSFYCWTTLFSDGGREERLSSH